MTDQKKSTAERGGCGLPGHKTCTGDEGTSYCETCEAESRAKAEVSQPATSLTIAELMLIIKRDNERWWRDLYTGEPIERNIGELLCLMHSEISEAMEGHRKNLMDDKLPHRKMFEVELADLVIRVLDTAVHCAPGLEAAIMEKLEYNRHRADHKEENRRLENGKKY
jgi:hypothetical protein